MTNTTKGTLSDTLLRLVIQLDRTVDALDIRGLDDRRRQCFGVADTIVGALNGDKVAAALSRQWVTL